MLISLRSWDGALRSRASSFQPQVFGYPKLIFDDKKPDSPNLKIQFALLHFLSAYNNLST